MIFEYDKEHDIGYLRLANPAKVDHTIGVSMNCHTEAMLNLDFDDHGRLVGIEANPASVLLHVRHLKAL